MIISRTFFYDNNNTRVIPTKGRKKGWARIAKV